MSPERKRERGKVKLLQVSVPGDLLTLVQSRKKTRDIFLQTLYKEATEKLIHDASRQGVVFYAVYSGKNTKRISVWLPTEIYRAAAVAASACGVALSTFCYTGFCRYFKYTSRSCVNQSK